MRHFGPAAAGVAALALLGLGAPQATACGLLWACADRPQAYRSGPRAHGYRAGNGYRSPARAYRNGYGYGRGGWVYGYTSPARAHGYPYAAWSSTSIPSSRWYLRSALPGGNTETVGLTPPSDYSGGGQLQGAWPARGPTLFGPNPPPAATGYYYGAYYGDPAYGYVAFPSRNTPPQQTPSWWVEPRRRR
jgi:hypothetical protein